MRSSRKLGKLKGENEWLASWVGTFAAWHLHGSFWAFTHLYAHDFTAVLRVFHLLSGQKSLEMLITDNFCQSRDCKKSALRGGLCPGADGLCDWGGFACSRRPERRSRGWPGRTTSKWKSYRALTDPRRHPQLPVSYNRYSLIQFLSSRLAGPSGQDLARQPDPETVEDEALLHLCCVRYCSRLGG